MTSISALRATTRQAKNLRLDPDDAANHGVAPVEQINGIYVGYNPPKGQWKLVFRAKNYFSYGYFVIDSSEPITATDIAGLDATDYPTPPLLMLNNGGTLTECRRRQRPVGRTMHQRSRRRLR